MCDQWCRGPSATVVDKVVGSNPTYKIFHVLGIYPEMTTDIEMEIKL